MWTGGGVDGLAALAGPQAGPLVLRPEPTLAADLGEMMDCMPSCVSWLPIAPFDLLAVCAPACRLFVQFRSRAPHPVPPHFRLVRP